MKETLLQIVQNLNVIKQNCKSLTHIEKDILLEELRKLYITVLETEPVEEVIEDTAKIETVPVIPTINIPEEPDLSDYEDADEAPLLIVPEIHTEPVTESVVEDVMTKNSEILMTEETTENEPEVELDEVPELEIVSTKEESVEETPEDSVKEKQKPVSDLIIEKEVKEEDSVAGDVFKETLPELNFIEEKNIPSTPQKEEAKTTKVDIKDDCNQLISSLQEQKETPGKKQESSQPQSKPIAETFQEKRSLNDLLQTKHEEKSLSDKMQESKINDLLKAISLNDKFLFIKELFNGKGEDFSACIQKLNSCADIEEAFETLELMKKNFYWESTSSAYLSLCDLIRRRYIK